MYACFEKSEPYIYNNPLGFFYNSPCYLSIKLNKNFGYLETLPFILFDEYIAEIKPPNL